MEVDAVDQLRAHERDLVVAKGPCTRSRARKHTHTYAHTHNTHARTHIHIYIIHTHTAFPSELHTAFPDKNDLHAMTVITDKYRCYLPVYPPPVVSIPTELQYPKLCLKYTLQYRCIRYCNLMEFYCTSRYTCTYSKYSTSMVAS